MASSLPILAILLTAYVGAALTFTTPSPMWNWVGDNSTDNNNWTTTSRPWGTTNGSSWGTTSGPWGTTNNSWWHTTSRPWHTTWQPWHTTARSWRTTDDYQNVTTEDPRPRTNVDASVAVFEKRLKAMMSSSYVLMKDNGTNNAVDPRKVNYDVGNVEIFGLDRLEITPDVAVIIDHNLLQINGSIYIIHPMINTSVIVTIPTIDIIDEKFKLTAIPDRKFKIYFSAIVSTRWDSLSIRRLSFNSESDSYQRDRYGYRTYVNNDPIFKPMIDCHLGASYHEICSDIEHYMDWNIFRKVPEKILSLLKTIVTLVKA